MYVISIPLYIIEGGVVDAYSIPVIMDGLKTDTCHAYM